MRFVVWSFHLLRKAVTRSGMTQYEKYRKLVKNIDESLEDIRTQLITAPNGITNALLMSIAENLALIADSLLKEGETE